MAAGEPSYDVAHLGHVELLTDRPQESLDFFVNVYGLTESGREGLTEKGPLKTEAVGQQGKNQAAYHRNFGRQVVDPKIFPDLPLG